MTSISQKKEESLYLNKFFALAGIRCSIESGTEPPDFFIKNKDLKIGIEITEFHSNLKNHKGRPRREVEGLWEKISQKISENISRSNSRFRNIYGQLYFKQLDVPPLAKQSRFVQQLFEFLQQNVGKLPTDNTCETKSLVVADDSFDLLNQYLNQIDLFYMPKCDMWTWNRSCGLVGLSEKELLDVIQKKNEKYRKRYTAEANENWLLIVSGNRISQAMGTVSIEELTGYKILLNYIEKGFFDKIYILQYSRNKLFSWQKGHSWEINVTK